MGNIIFTMENYVLTLLLVVVSVLGYVQGENNCTYNAVSHRIYSTWIASDGCNFCSCTPSGVQCSHDDCFHIKSCQYGGRSFIEGEHFVEDCNSCVCTKHGPACTEMLCQDPNPPNIGKRN